MADLTDFVVLSMVILWAIIIPVSFLLCSCLMSRRSSRTTTTGVGAPEPLENRTKEESAGGLTEAPSRIQVAQTERVRPNGLDLDALARRVGLSPTCLEDWVYELKGKKGHRR
jgi:hypothetical protein